MSLTDPVLQAARVLGVPLNADPVQVTHAYRDRARRLHPDVSKDPDAHTQFVSLQAAYRIALDEARQRLRTRRGEAAPDATSTPGDCRGATVVLETCTTAASHPVVTGTDAAWLLVGPVMVQPFRAGGVDSP
jgi:DnaJ-class molecular chaperone